MKLEIKKLDISSIVFSGFTIALFFVSLIVAIIAIFVTPNPIWLGEPFKAKFIGCFFYTFTFFLITLAYLSFLVFIYNFFIGVIGMSGLKIEVEESAEK
ncbi:MAG: hypothetical protein ACP5SD_05310 [Elusimicrobiales bacterium]|jgi:hypothetical protein|nr:hypothetical protein [Elusimicrobiales bacterium]HOJ85549.1 hypothetical protein [Elusimicrobiales bacterium]HOL61937.1 hypothetical protein [Elusimicrobiales bacterium]HPO95154.1 hypothetical protein [Elusimicrobiales bacterium]